METLLAGAQGKLRRDAQTRRCSVRQVENRVIATARDSLLAAAEYLRTQGIPAVILGDSITGESRDVAKVFAALVKEIRSL